MIDRFLKARHWQMFLFAFGIPFVFQIILTLTMASKIISQPELPPTELLTYIRFMPVIMLIFMAVFYGWMWSVSLGLQAKLAKNITMKTLRFKVLFTIPMIYLFAFIVAFVFFVDKVVSLESDPNPAVVLTVIAVIMPFHLFAAFCLLYVQYFTAKTIKTVEFQREVTFGDFIGEFVLIWLYPIGIWFLQPKINSLASDNKMGVNQTPV